MGVSVYHSYCSCQKYSQAPVNVTFIKFIINNWWLNLPLTPNLRQASVESANFSEDKQT